MACIRAAGLASSRAVLGPGLDADIAAIFRSPVAKAG